MKHDIRLVGHRKDIKLDKPIALFYQNKNKGIFVHPEDIEKYGFKKARQMRINLLLHLIDTLPQK